ncbi:ABC transporter permease [Streptomyces sp. NBC_01304]|uniref:ABC transporter permease n=1 Tax=Streptomyces sp. NBC_01304 TaxID=2903818 RepID=UPI002E0FEFE6|nr:U32 family peptidase C-terminal domain-containing protein [Streptomyces sp. NBC_01304]
MNFVKRAALSLRARKGKTALLFGIFLVICTLLTGGFVLRDGTARQEADARRRIGVDATVKGDELTPAAADRLGRSPLVQRYNALVESGSRPAGLSPLPPRAPRPEGVRGRPGDGDLRLTGVRESDLLLDFAVGRKKIVDGRGITARDAGRKVAVVEQRLAGLNKVKVGDRIELASPDGRRKEIFEVVGLFEDPAPEPLRWVPVRDNPAHQIYAPRRAVSALDPAAPLEEALFKVKSPDHAEQLRGEARKVLGKGPFRFDVNSKAYEDQVRPIQRIGVFADIVVWLISFAGAVVLGLIVLLTIRERRDELGVLLSLGEKKWRLIGQHTVEVAAVAVPALGLAALCGLALAQPMGDALVDSPRTDSASRAWQAEAPRPAEFRLTGADAGRVAGVGLGISLVATVVPGIGILRLHPRSILTASE